MRPAPSSLLPAVVLSAVLAASPATSEVTLKSQAQADLDVMRTRATELADQGDAMRWLERLSQNRGDPTAALLDLVGRGRDGKMPIRYRDAMLANAAAQRAQILSAVLSADLDNDGTVTREEISRVLQVGRSNGMLGDLFLKFDTNIDDRISPDELVEGMNAAGEEQSSQRGDRASMIGTLLDFNDDGQITQKELDRAVAALVLQSAPIDGAAVPAPIADSTPARAASCDVVAPTPVALVHVVTGYEGNALSNLSIGGQDRVTETAELVIEPGDEPLYVVVASYELVLWRVTGAVDRVERIVVQSGTGSSDIRSGAVAGLPAEKVTFVAAGACLAGGWEKSADKDAAATMRKRFGRDVAGVVADYTIASVSLPSGKGGDGPRGEVDIVVSGGKRYILTEEGMVEEPTPKAGEEDGAIDRELNRFHPGGVVKIDPKTVVSAYPVEPYVVLPQQAGLAQLMEQGLIKRQGNAFLVLQPIPRFPAGLYGAHSVSFVLGPDVPLPPGDPGHSSVRDATRACLVRMCR
jgi:Ca2+-binding EF-hand superfamily protein